MGYFKPGTVWQEGNVNNSMILKMNADKKPWPGIYIKSRFGIVLIQKMKEEIIAMLFAAFYNLLPFKGLLSLIHMKVSETVMVSFFVVRTLNK